MHNKNEKTHFFITTTALSETSIINKVSKLFTVYELFSLNVLNLMYNMSFILHILLT